MSAIEKLRGQARQAMKLRMELDTDLKEFKLLNKKVLSKEQALLGIRLQQQYCKAIQEETRLIIAVSRLVVLDFKLYRATLR